MVIIHDEVTIANGSSQSAVIDVSERVIVALHLPSSWTAAQITLLAARTSDGTYLPVYDAAGTELTIEAAASRVVELAPDATRGLKFVKLRSGTAGVPVNQLADRTVLAALVMDTAS